MFNVLMKSTLLIASSGFARSAGSTTSTVNHILANTSPNHTFIQFDANPTSQPECASTH